MASGATYSARDADWFLLATERILHFWTFWSFGIPTCDLIVQWEASQIQVLCAFSLSAPPPAAYTTSEVGAIHYVQYNPPKRMGYIVLNWSARGYQQSQLIFFVVNAAPVGSQAAKQPQPKWKTQFALATGTPYKVPELGRFQHSTNATPIRTCRLQRNTVVQVRARFNQQQSYARPTHKLYRVSR